MKYSFKFGFVILVEKVEKEREGGGGVPLLRREEKNKMGVGN